MASCLFDLQYHVLLDFLRLLSDVIFFCGVFVGIRWIVRLWLDYSWILIEFSPNSFMHDLYTLLQDAANATLRSETLWRKCVRCINRKQGCKKTILLYLMATIQIRASLPLPSLGEDTTRLKPSQSTSPIARKTNLVGQTKPIVRRELQRYQIMHIRIQRRTK